MPDTRRAQATIEKKGYSDQRAKTVLMDALRGRGGQLTRADAVAVSGLPQDETDRALTLLLKEYRSHLAATDSGELLYQFDPAFERRDAVPWRERAARVAAVLWKGFTFLFKITIVGTLVVYFTAFVLMLLALFFARTAGRDGDSDDDGGGGFGGLFWLWGWDSGSDPRRRGRSGPRQPPLYKSVFAFVFGPPAPAVDPLADEKEIVACIRANDGRIAAADLVRLMGWDFARAEEELTRLMVDYGGEPEVTDDGVVLYVFKDLRKTAGALGGLVRPKMAWERLEPEPVLTGNSGERNAVIGLFNAFNLTAPLWIVPLFEAKFRISMEGWSFLLHDFPLAFSGVFFAVPGLRWLKARLGRKPRATRNQRRTLLGSVFAAMGLRTREDLAPTPALAEALDQNLVALGGDVQADDDGRLRYHFPRIQQETAAAAKARANAPALEQAPGRVVFSSAE